MERWKGRAGGEEGGEGEGKRGRKRKRKKKREREGEIKRERIQWLERGSQKGYLWGEACSLEVSPCLLPGLSGKTLARQNP